MNVIRQTPYVSPDSMRQKLHMDERLFNGYTPKSFGYTATNQTQYASNIQNWGSELLLETRKLRLNRPPLGDIRLLSQDDDAFKQFFDLRYDDNPDTYEQECTVTAVLKKDVIHNRKIYLTFENVKKVILPRALSDSEEKVYAHIMWKTNLPPVLHVQEYEGSSTYATYPLVAYHKDSTNPTSTTYWFENTTSRGNQATLQEMLIEFDTSTSTTAGTLQTIPFETWMEELPLIWMTFDDLKTLPSIGFEGNVGANGWPILTAGTDGHGNHYLYPFLYGDDNLPGPLTDGITDWQIRVYSRYTFVEGWGDVALVNQSQEISHIEFVSFKKDDPYSAENHGEVIRITYDNAHVRLRFTDTAKWGFKAWTFRKAKEGDWDYDGTTYNNPVYGYINYHYRQMHYSQSPTVLVPIFRIIPQFGIIKKDDHLRHNVAVGIHPDAASEYSQNAVIKKNGAIFNLADFDGLPPYYYYKLPRDVSRAHTEMYAVKDKLNTNVDDAMDNRVAAMFVDSSIPQNTISEITEEMDSAIVFDYTKLRTYKTDESKVLTINNVMSDIVYVDRGTFADVNKKGYDDNKQFVYHGHRTFSLGAMGLDPELETGRVYYLSNDGASYENNETAIVSKPKRTVARICDIPTEMNQLIGIKGVAPTITIDEYYTRTEQPYTLFDRSRVWQVINNGVIVHSEDGKYIFNAEALLEEELPYEYMRKTYFAPEILNPTITMADGFNAKNVALSGQYYWNIADGGVGYTIGDVVQGYIAGHIMKGTVIGVDGTGSVTEVMQYDPDAEDLEIPALNFYGNDTYIDCTTIKKAKYGSRSEGLRLHLHLDSFVWPYSSQVLMDQYIRYTHIPNLFAFQFDVLGNIWLYEYQYHEDEEAAIALFTEEIIRDQLDEETDEHYQEVIQTEWDRRPEAREKYLALTGLEWVPVCQMTGDTVSKNAYDDPETRPKRGLFSVLMQMLQWKILKDAYGSYDQFWRLSTITRVARGKIITPEIEAMMEVDELNAKSIYNAAVMEYIKNNPIMFEGGYITFTEAGGIVDGKDQRDINIHRILPNIGNYKEFALPVSHKAIVRSLGGLPNQLIFENVDKIRNGKNFQPIIYVYNPKSTTYENITSITYNTAQVIDHNEVTYADISQLTNGVTLWNQYGSYIRLEIDIWKYTGYEETMIDNPKHPYHPNIDDDEIPLQQLGQAGDTVLQVKNRRYESLQEQPTGAMHNVSSRQYPSKYKTGRGRLYDSELLYFFKLPDEADLIGFHMKDEFTQEDISRYCILLYRKRLYYYNESIDRWKLVSGKETDEDAS